MNLSLCLHLSFMTGQTEKRKEEQTKRRKERWLLLFIVSSAIQERKEKYVKRTKEGRMEGGEHRSGKNTQEY